MLFLYVCPKVVLLGKLNIPFFAFKIRTSESILCSFGLCVPKLYFHLNLKWHCLHLRGILDPLKPLKNSYRWIYPLHIWFVWTKVVFSLESKMALFTFGIQDPLKTLEDDWIYQKLVFLEKGQMAFAPPPPSFCNFLSTQKTQNLQQFFWIGNHPSH